MRNVPCAYKPVEHCPCATRLFGEFINSPESLRIRACQAQPKLNSEAQRIPRTTQKLPSLDHKSSMMSSWRLKDLHEYP